MSNERKLYTVKFNHYEFTDGNKKIWFKEMIDLETNKIIAKDVYIDRDDAVFLIGNLAYEEIIEFIGDIYLDEQSKLKISNPKNIRKIESLEFHD